MHSSYFGIETAHERVGNSFSSAYLSSHMRHYFWHFGGAPSPLSAKCCRTRVHSVTRGTSPPVTHDHPPTSQSPGGQRARRHPPRPRPPGRHARTRRASRPPPHMPARRAMPHPLRRRCALRSGAMSQRQRWATSPRRRRDVTTLHRHWHQFARMNGCHQVASCRICTSGDPFPNQRHSAPALGSASQSDKLAFVHLKGFGSSWRGFDKRIPLQRRERAFRVSRRCVIRYQTLCPAPRKVHATAAACRCRPPRVALRVI